MTNEEMFNKNINIAYKLANKYRINYAKEFEDIKQIALMGLWKAVLAYEENKSAFSTFAYSVISNEINMYVRTLKKLENEVSLEIPVRTIDGNLTLKDTIPEDSIDILNDTVASVSDLMVCEASVLKAIRLDYREIYLMLKAGKTQKEVAEYSNISQAQVSRIYNMILKLIKNRFDKI